MLRIPGALCLLAALMPMTQLHAQVQDTVFLRSGHPVIGEVKALWRGKLDFDTDEMGLVNIDWDDVAFVVSDQFFEIELTSGEEYFGSISYADTAMLVIVGPVADTIPFRDVVSILQHEDRFWARTNGFVDVGTNITRANKLRSVLIRSRFAYRGPKWGFHAEAESYWQSQETTSDMGDTVTTSTQRHTYSTGVTRFVGARWAAIVTTQVEKNEELSLDRRFVGDLSGAYQFIRNQGIELSLAMGAALNAEQFTGEEAVESGEALVALAFDAFDIGNVDVFANLTTYSNPTGDGRFRFNLDARIAWEIFGDFSIGLNVTERYDSAPPSLTAQKRDYQYVFTIGWSWS
jgi:Protein of unknown function, DUF481